MSDTNSVAIMNQVPDAAAGVRAESPLHHADLATVAQKGNKSGGVHFRELGLMGHLTLRCDPKNAELTSAAAGVLGVELPFKPLTSVESGDTIVRWIAPDEWLITVSNDKAFDLESRFRAEMNGHYSLVNGSGGLTMYKLAGDKVVDMLKKSTPVDLHETEFPVGKVVSTVFAKAGAIIRRTGANEFELVVRRSFADYLWLWIQSASEEFGLVVEA